MKFYPSNTATRNSIVESRKVAAAYRTTLLMLAPLIALYWVLTIGAGQTREMYQILNATVPVYFCIVLLLLGYKVLKVMPDALWTGTFWFPIQAAIFYGFGPLVEIYGNEVTLRGLSSHYLSVTYFELFNAHKLSTTGISLILLGILLHIKFFPRSWIRKNNAAPPLVSLSKLGIAMVVYGGIFKYLLLLPTLWGIWNFMIAGVLSAMGNVVDLGFAILAFLTAKGNRSIRGFFWLFWPIHLGLSILTFSKLSIVIAILMPVLGAYLAHKNRNRLLFKLAALVLVYASLQPLVHHGRGAVIELSGNINNAGYLDRIDAVGSFITSEKIVIGGYADGRQGWWTRLNFAGPQALAMKLYDQSGAKPMLGDAWMYFIPRAIWPNKPIMIGQGLEFYRLASSNSEGESFLGLSIYGDLYWQYGWGGVFLGSLLVGLLFGLLSSQSLRAIRSRNFIMLPAVLMALEVTLLSPNKYITTGIIGPLPIYFAFYILLAWYSKTVVSRSERY